LEGVGTLWHSVCFLEIKPDFMKKVIVREQFISQTHCKNFLFSATGRKNLPNLGLNFPVSFEEAFNTCFMELFEKEDLLKIANATKDNAEIYDNKHNTRLLNQCWPTPNFPDHPRNMRGELIYSDALSFINKDTPITSIGSCFAVEMAQWLQKNGYNYIIGKNSTRNSKGLYPRSVDIGNIYNTPSLVQLLKWALGKTERPYVFYESNDCIIDPFSEEIPIENNDIDHHISRLKETYNEFKLILQKSKVVVLTFGLNEVYQFLPTMDYMFRIPNGLSPHSFKKKFLTVEENYKNISEACSIIKELNPDCQIIISISPVPLMRSFQKGKHIAESTMLSKATLRLAAEGASKLPNVYYFPSFETAMYPGSSSASVFKEDERHVTADIVDKIMATFESLYCERPKRLFKSPHFGNYGLSKNTILSLEIAHKSFEDIAEIYSLEKSLIGKLHDSLAINSIKGESNSELAYRYFRSVTNLTQLNLNHIQGQYFKNYGNFKSLHPIINLAAKSLKEKGWVLIKTKGFNDLERAIRNYFEYNELICNRSGEQISYSTLLQNCYRNNIPKGCIKYKYQTEKLPLTAITSFFNLNLVPEICKTVLGHIGYGNIYGWTNVKSDADNNALSTAALRYHYDCDNMGKWIKSFIFLNDVDETNGAHVFVEGSHHNLDKSFSTDGRFDDEHVLAKYPSGPHVVKAQAGDILLADTIGLHKGSPVVSGHRDLLQITLCQTALGSPKPETVNFVNKFLNDLNLH